MKSTWIKKQIKSKSHVACQVSNNEDYIVATSPRGPKEHNLNITRGNEKKLQGVNRNSLTLHGVMYI